MNWKPVKRYFWNMAISLDQLVSTATGGDPDETVSSRLGKAERRGNKFACFFCRALDFIQKDHCAKSIEEDEGDKAGV